MCLLDDDISWWNYIARELLKISVEGKKDKQRCVNNEWMGYTLNKTIVTQNNIKLHRLVTLEILLKYSNNIYK